MHRDVPSDFTNTESGMIVDMPGGVTSTNSGAKVALHDAE